MEFLIRMRAESRAELERHISLTAFARVMEEEEPSSGRDLCCKLARPEDNFFLEDGCHTCQRFYHERQVQLWSQVDRENLRKY